MKRLAKFYFSTSASKKLCIFNFFVMFSVERGVFVFYLQEHGHGLSEIGWLQVVFSISLFVFELPSGAVADMYGRVLALVLGGCIMTISLAGQYAVVGNIYALGSFFILHAVAFSLISGSLSALLYQFLEAEGKAAMFGKLYAVTQFAGSLSLGLAMVAAGALMGWGGWPAVYMFASVSPLIGTLFLLSLFSKEKKLYTSKTPEIHGGAFFKELKRITPYAFPFAMMHAAMTPYFLYASTQFHAMGIDLANASATVGFTEIVCAGGVALLIRKVPNDSQRWWAFLMFLFAMFMFLQFFYGPFTAIAVFFICNALVLWLALASNQFVNGIIEEGRLRATTLSAVSFLDMLLISVGFIVYGYISDRYSIKVGLQVLGLFPFVGGVVLMVQMKTRR